MKLKQSTETAKRTWRQAMRVLLTMSIMLLPQTAFAEGGDPLAVVNNLSDFIFALIRAIGIILLGLKIPRPIAAGQWLFDLGGRHRDYLYKRNSESDHRVMRIRT